MNFGTAELFGRANTQDRPQSDQAAYLFRASNTGAWSIDKSDTSGNITTLASGTVAALGTGTWHHLALTFSGSSISAAIDGTTVDRSSCTCSEYLAGWLGSCHRPCSRAYASTRATCPAGRPVSRR